ncbi:peptidoglycan-binding protein [Geitlerinema sp. CS-897]|nr:peptidoglycan-binding protein [Geitlerinema sp. CS-897]
MDSLAYTQLYLAYESETTPNVVFKPSIMAAAPVALALALVAAPQPKAEASYGCYTETYYHYEEYEYEYCDYYYDYDPCYSEPVEHVSGYDYYYVVAIQDRLKALGYFPHGVNSTGYYGPITIQAVKDFQYDYGLAVDGVVGPNTDSALFGYAQYPDTSTQPVTYPDTGLTYDETVRLQEYLAQEPYYYTGPIDGIYGVGTMAGVVEAQKQLGLEVEPWNPTPVLNKLSEMWANV